MIESLFYHVPMYSCPGNYLCYLDLEGQVKIVTFVSFFALNAHK